MAPSKPFQSVSRIINEVCSGSGRAEQALPQVACLGLYTIHPACSFSRRSTRRPLSSGPACARRHQPPFKPHPACLHFAPAGAWCLQRFEQKAMEIHLRKLEAVKAVVDTSEPQYMHHLDHNAKKAERDAVRQLEIEQVGMGSSSDISCVHVSAWAELSDPAGGGPALQQPATARLTARHPNPVVSSPMLSLNQPNPSYIFRRKTRACSTSCPPLRILTQPRCCALQWSEARSTPSECANSCITPNMLVQVHQEGTRWQQSLASE